MYRLTVKNYDDHKQIESLEATRATAIQLVAGTFQGLETGYIKSQFMAHMFLEDVDQGAVKTLLNPGTNRELIVSFE